jgi:hypothetical protein
MAKKAAKTAAPKTAVAKKRAAKAVAPKAPVAKKRGPKGGMGGKGK